ncbi:hypothetical protein CP6013_04043 [Clostridium pasteurianum DSM 525 = ATCC 6013]|uniref:Uncharacterized protein n=1 Tax=Clostridium pasteurianum DSM 525 = ATCC 6013 TaxID=1262449 RepID=A0A837S1R2_CLOPA|nr:hypothetical protein [Clostridium pasteurianum]KRU10751.1 hypothetical protein CP6013_04043 [Clostridium pasteurianum DSM 525 = ATCC 6013]
MNLIPDGSFENGGVGWGSGGQLVDDGHSGVHCIRFQNSGGSKTLKNPIVVSLDENTEYHFGTQQVLIIMEQIITKN